MDEINKSLFIVAGANGSGKTTLVNELLSNLKIVHINADEIAKNINKEDLDKVKIQAGKIAIKKIDESLKLNKSFSIETTLSGNFLFNVIKKVKKLNYKIYLYYIYLDNYNICVRAGNHCAKLLKDELGIKNTCRISLYLYNTKEEIDKLIEVLKNSKNIFEVVI